MVKHIETLINDGIKFAPDTTISLPVARDHGLYAGILYSYLQRKQHEQSSYGDSYNVRRGIRWIPSLAASTIVQELPALPDTKTVIRAADALETAGLILTERTGEFLPKSHRTNRKRDIATWWHVSKEYVARKVPAEYLDTRHNYIVSAIEVAAYGVAEALILAYWRRSDPAEWRKLSATEMAEVLPMDERTIRRHFKSMIKRKILLQHEQKPKLYRLGGCGSGVSQEKMNELPKGTKALRDLVVGLN
jgi:hypothetical protein